MTLIAFPFGDGCPDGGRLVDSDVVNGHGVVWCATCGRYACAEPTTTDGSVWQVERHRRKPLTVTTVAPSTDPLPHHVRLPRADGRLTRDELRELSAQCLGVLAATHPLDHDGAHPVDSEPF